jgi:hypothetical protein
MISYSLKDWIGLSLFTATGAAGTGYYLIDVISGSLARRWPALTGRVTSSRVEQIPGRFGSSYKPCVEYEYAVAGVTYSGDQRRFDDDAYMFKSSAAWRLVGYAPGTPIVVYYDPHDPSTSVLEPGTEWRTYSTILFFGAWFVFGLGALLGYLK